MRHAQNLTRQYTCLCAIHDLVPSSDALSEALKSKGIPNGVYYPKGIHEYSVFADKKFPVGSLPVVEKVSREVISLPMHPWLTIEDQDTIVAAVESSLFAAVS